MDFEKIRSLTDGIEDAEKIRIEDVRKANSKELESHRALGKYLAEIRKSKGIAANQMATETLLVSAVSDLENGRRRWTKGDISHYIRTIQKLSKK